jgi:hypothetical protein
MCAICNGPCSLYLVRERAQSTEPAPDNLEVTITMTEYNFTLTFVRQQPAGPRTFKVSGPKADAVRTLAIAGGLTRKQIAEQAACSVSRVAEVLWGLDYDGIAYDVPAKAAPVANQAAIDAAILADAAE